MDLDFMSALLDEVALEGLDGVTLSMLWLRLEKRPHFPISLDVESKGYLWNCVAVHKDVEIYELPEARKLVPIYDRYEHIDSELGIVLETTENVIDSYPVSFVKDGDIRGSCSTYDSRVCISSEIRCNDVILLHLKEVNDKWGEKLVLVASPKARLRALIGTETNPLVEMSQEEYCLLERIGRSRYLGEVTQGEGGLLSLKAPFCKQLHYYRKKLTLKGLVTKQLHYMKNKNQATTGSLFHITRFYVQRKTRMELFMKRMCDLLKDKPQNRELSRVLREELNINENAFKKLFNRCFQKWVRIVTIPYKEFYPQASAKESFTATGQDRMIKVVQLVRHCDEVDNNNEDEETTQDKEQYIPPNIHFDCSKIYYDQPLILQVYRIVQQAGPEGITSADLRRIITLPMLDVRALLQTLIKNDYIVTVMQERGRQKETKYIAKSVCIQNEAYYKAKEEEEELRKTGLSADKSQKKSNAEKIKNTSKDNTSLASNRVRFSDKIAEVMLHEPEENDKCSDSSKEISFQRVVSEVSEIEGSDIFTCKAPELINLSEEIANPILSSATSQLTHRKVKRMKIVLDNLKSVRFTTLTDLHKLLMDKEREEGCNFKVDKKSTARFVHKLHAIGKLKIIKTDLKLNDQKSEIEFICDKSIQASDQCIISAVQLHKFKFFSLYRENQKKLETDVKKDAKPPDDKCLNEINQLTENLSNTSLTQNPLNEAQTHPKCLRSKTLHKFLFYLVYQYEGHSGDNSKTPTVYHNSMTWKRFVNPLPMAYKEGWCFLAHVYACMPLSVFVKVVNLRHKIKEFGEYLMDEEKCHYPITHLPRDIFKRLLADRRYLFAFHDVLKCLCYMGLITFGPRVAKQKEQVYLYIHRKAAVMDTTISTPGYIHINTELAYAKKMFHFNTLADVEQFWMELESICFHTSLGKYSSVAGETIVFSEASHKPELIETLKNKNFDEISDVGHIPGDGLGAGGFDSSLFLYCRRNWQSSNIVKNMDKCCNLESFGKHRISIQNFLKTKEMSRPEGCNGLNQYSLSSQKDKTAQDSRVKKSKLEGTAKKSKVECSKLSAPAIIPKNKRFKFRTVKSCSKKTRQPYYDIKDRAAIQRLSGARCEWSSQEDSFLLMCKVASSFLDPSSKLLVVPYTVVRDLLHEKFPDVSANKSSWACRSRVRHMMMNPTTANNVAVVLGEAEQDENLVKEFDRVKPARANEAIWKELFTGALKRLLEKFTLPVAKRCKIVELPDSIEEFHKMFDVISPSNVFHCNSNHKDPENEEEITYSTLYSFIVSAMAINEDGTEWSYLLHKLCQVYPEYMLQSVVSRLRSEKVIAIKRKSKKDLQRSLMFTFPYEFSVTYENTLLTKFPIKLFNEAKEFLDNLNYGHSNEKSLELKEDVAPGYAAAVLALAPLKDLSLTVEIPDEIISFDTCLNKEAQSNIVECMNHTLSNKESVEHSRLLNSEKDFSDSGGNTDDQNIVKNLNEKSAIKQAKENLKKKLTGESSQIAEIQQSTNVSRIALYKLRQKLSQPHVERVQHSQDDIVLNSCKVFCHLKPRVTQTESTVKRLTDGCISEIQESLTAFIPSEIFSEDRNFDELLKKIYDAYPLQTLNDAKNIFEEIIKTKSIGISETNICQKFKVLNGDLLLIEHLHLFREAMLVIRAGVASFVYICATFAKNWVLTSYVLPEMCYKKKSKDNKSKFLASSSANVEDCEMEDLYENTNSSQIVGNFQIVLNKDDDNFTHQGTSASEQTSISNVSLQDPAITFTEEVHFLPRTWRHPDGTLNKVVFIKLLKTVLGYIISSPGVNTSRVIERFSLALQPVQILELLEILEKACCIVKYYTKKRPKRTLFSKPFEVTTVDTPNSDDLDHLEPLRDAVCNIAKIQEAIM